MRTLCLLCGCCILTSAGSEASDQPRVRNVVFVLVDDLGWKDLQCYGSTFHQTPNLDRLAASGLRFTDAYAACPVCSPTRAAIMTGQHPARVGITDWIPGQSPTNRRLLSNVDRDQLPLEHTTLAEALKAADYRTFFAGKWHLGSDGYLPQDQGFDINKGGHHRGSPPGGYYSPYKNPQLENGPNGEYLPDRLATESVRFLESVGDDPFLLYLSFYTVHTPIQADKQSVARFQKAARDFENPPAATKERSGLTRARQDRADYASMVAGMDRNVGRVLDALDRLNLTEQTAVFFTSDNGGLSTLRRANAPTCNLPLRAGKGWCYEGGIRVPLIVRVPGVTKPGSVSSVPVTSMDYYPTILSLLGQPARPDQHVDGADLTKVLSGADSLERTALYWHYPHYHGSTWTPGAAMRSGRWKLIEFYDSDEFELYDLSADLGERRDLSRSHPEQAAKLRQQLRDWQAGIGARMPRRNPTWQAE